MPRSPPGGRNRRAIRSSLDDRYAEATTDRGSVTVDVGDLAAQLADASAGAGDREIVEERRRITLLHRDLPLLHDAGLLTDDPERDHVTYPTTDRSSRLTGDALRA